MQLGGWQRLANRIQAPVFCPSWMPDPLVPQIGNRWNNIDSVDKDGSYLESWAWQEAAGLNTQEIHVILRGYPGADGDPADLPGRDDGQREDVPEEDRVLPGPERHLAIDERDHGDALHGQPRADSWHALFAWKHDGSLYTLSEHIAPPLTSGRSSPT